MPSNTSLYGSTANSSNVGSNNFTTLYSPGAGVVRTQLPYGNSNVVSLLNIGTDGGNTVTNIVATGNMTIDNITANANITADYYFGNGAFLTGLANLAVANANYANFAGTAFSVAGANVSGIVANANYSAFANVAASANSVAVANVVGIGNIAVLNLDGSSSNVLFGNGVFAPESTSIANANYANFAGTAFSVAGANVSGEVANANYASFANVASIANSVAGANVSGEVANANYASYANIAASANSVAVANVVGIGNIATINLDGSSSNVLFGNGIFAPESTSIANANYANFAGNVVNSTQSNITTLGTLTDLRVNNTQIHLGTSAGISNQGNLSIAIGLLSGVYNQGSNSIAIGANAGVLNQANNSIIINATGSNVNQTSANTFTVKPVSQGLTGYLMFYDNGTGIISYDLASNATVGNANVANYANFAGQVVDATQSNITSLGTLTGLSVTGNANINGTLTLSLNSGFLPKITALSDSVNANSRILAITSGSINSANIANGNTAGNLIFNAGGAFAFTDPGSRWNAIGGITQITSGPGLTANGSANGGDVSLNAGTGYSNLYAATGGIVSLTGGFGRAANGDSTGGTVTFTSGRAQSITTGTSTSGNLNLVIGSVSGPSGNVRGNINIGSLAANATTTFPGNINIGQANTPTNIGGDANIAGNLTVVGNITANFFNGNGSLLTGIVATSANFANFAGNVTVSSQPNITSVANSFSSGQLTLNTTGAGVPQLSLNGTAGSSNAQLFINQGSLVVTNTDLSGGASPFAFNIYGNSGYQEPMNYIRFRGVPGTPLDCVGGDTVLNQRWQVWANSTFNDLFSVGVTYGGFNSGVGAYGNYGFNASSDVANSNILFNAGNISLFGSVFGNTFTGNGNGLSNIQGANVSGAVSFATTANSVAVGNVSGIGNIATTNFDGNSSNALLGNGVFGAITVGSVANANYANFAGEAFNVSSANITGTINLANFATTANAVAGANVSGAVSFATTANSVAVANVSGLGNIATTNYDGNASNVLYGNGNFYALPTISNVANANFANFAGEAFNVAAANITGTVNLANFATTANAVAGANVSGIVANANFASYSEQANNANLATYATTANAVAGANVSGYVANATHSNIADVANSVSGSNVSGQVANALVAGTVYTNAQPNITSVGNLTSVNVSGDGLIAGNLTVGGNISYVNVNNLVVQDPVIELGGGPNGAPLTTNDGKDRGTLLHYYTTQPIDAFMGWDNGNGEFAFGSNVTNNTDVMTFNTLGNVRAQTFIGNLTGLASSATVAASANAVAGANVSGAVAYATTANSVAVGNVSGIGNIATVNLDGNASNILFGNGTFSAIPVVSNVANANYANFAGTAYSVSGANVSGEVANANFASYANLASTANLATFATTANSVAGANVSGEVANANYASFANVAATANSVAVANVSGIGNIATVNLDGNASNLLYGNGIFAPISISSVANANYANFAGEAFSVAAANISGTVNLANFATTANSVAGANVSGQVANSLIAGTVYTNAQPNITSVGTLTSLTVSGNLVPTNIVLDSFNETVVASANTGTSISPNVANGTIFNFTANNNFTFSNLTSVVSGTSATVIITQDATGNRLLTSTMLFAGASKTLSTAASAKDIISVFYDGTNYFATLSKGYA